MTGQPALDRLAARMGVVDAYVGLDGVERRTSPATKRALLAAMGRAADNEIQAAAADEIAGITERTGRRAPGVMT